MSICNKKNFYIYIYIYIYINNFLGEGVNLGKKKEKKFSDFWGFQSITTFCQILKIKSPNFYSRFQVGTR